MSGDRQVMVVDDDADLRDSVTSALQDEGYHVIAAENGREALRRLSQEPKPAVILLDLMMPVMDGFAFRAEQTRDPRIAPIPIVVFSAHGSTRESAEQLHAAGYLKKPFRLDQLFDVLERALQLDTPGP